MEYLAMLGAGAVTGVFSGIFGIGGGVVLVPMLVLLAGLKQHEAGGTSLVAMLAPVGALGVYEYYKAGKIGPDNLKYGALIALGIFFGTYFGSRIALLLPAVALRRAFALLMVIVAGRLWLV